MAIKVLSSSTSLVPGSDLWILADPEHSTWTRKLDWYLNFQLSKAESHKSPTLTPDQQKSLKDFELPDLSVSLNSNAPLIIATRSFFPNHQTVVLPYNGNLKEWMQEASEIWEKLESPSIRVFLPKSTSPGDFEKAWPTKTSEILFSVVADG